MHLKNEIMKKYFQVFSLNWQSIIHATHNASAKVISCEILPGNLSLITLIER